MDPSGNSSLDPAPFEHLLELRREHDKLLDSYDSAMSEDASPVPEAHAARRVGAAVGTFIARGIATGRVLEAHAERMTAQTLVDYWTTVQIRAGAEIPRRRLASFDEHQLPVLSDDLCPYVGLEPFRSGENFYGRSAETDRLFDLVVANPLVIVHGSSGTGKSSLVFGGLVSRLREQRPSWTVRMLTPGTDGDVKLVAAVPRTPPSLAVAEVLIIDQFEELFTLSSEGVRTRFDEQLRKILDRQDVRVVATIREEFFARVARLKSCATYADFSMRPMSYEDLVEAIERPAAAINLKFERGVVESLAGDVLGQPAALPLLQFALQRLWSARDRNRITKKKLDELGGPRDALAKAADRFVDAQIPETQTEIERILVELVRVDDLLESYRQPLRRGKLLAAGNARTGEVIELLEKEGLIRVSGEGDAADPVIDIRHEAIIRNWPRLDRWIVQKRKLQRNQLALLQAAQLWDRGGRTDEGLYRGAQLKQATELDGLSRLEQEFIDASLAAGDRERARKRSLAFWFYGSVVLLAVVLGVLAFLIERRIAAQTARDRDEAQAQLSAATAQLAAARRDRDAAMLDREEQEAKAQELQRTIDKLKSKANAVADEAKQRFSDALKAAAATFARKQIDFHAVGQSTDATALVSLVRLAGVQAGLERDVKANPQTAMNFYYEEDRTAAITLSDVFATYLGTPIAIYPRINDPQFFGPGKSPPFRGLLEVYFRDGAVPAIATGASPKQ